VRIPSRSPISWIGRILAALAISMSLLGAAMAEFLLIALRHLYLADGCPRE
jgi:hypothetical protein